ncbi:transcriptional regulatory protein [Bdellovibrio bacteriovorus W]|nr:transcriptional regulatory protein [Bdellovibrio bacteriovorus W]
MTKPKGDCQPTPLSCSACGMKADSLLCSSPDVLLAVEKVRTSCHYKAGQVIFYSGNMSLGIFTIQSGLVKLEAVSPNGAAHTLRLVGAGGALGYRSLFANEPYHASAIAVEDCELCFIPKAEIMSIFAAHPHLAMKLLTHVSKDLRMAEEKWVGQMDKGAPERVAEALVFLQDHFSQQQWTRREIAQWAGTTPETVIRTLAQFEKDGLIDQSDGRNIRILSKERLAARMNGLG